jgi:5-methylcytosine-specific restriction endonuclease McrA
MNGDCLELMKLIPEGSVDFILTSYVTENKSMRQIAKQMSTNHKLIGRILKNNNIETRPYKNLRGLRKFPCDIDLQYNNMATHLKWDVDINWLKTFRDFNKLKFLNKSITNRDNRFPFNTDEYKKFIVRFYYCEQFNLLYKKWEGNKKDKYLKPSVDHIIPKSKGGTNDLDNLQFLSWFENRCKNDLTQEEWNKLKFNIEDYLL